MVTVLCALVSACLAVAGTGTPSTEAAAQTKPAAERNQGVSGHPTQDAVVTVAGDRKQNNSAKTTLLAGCTDRAVRKLAKAGFSGNNLRIAYAITWRESRHQNLDEQSPHFSGALGWWQVQSSAHSDKKWWSRSKMLNPAKQSRVVYRHLSQKGTNFSHWGITADGNSIDSTYYSGWTTDQQQAWIWQPYVQGLQEYDQLPAECTFRTSQSSDR